MYISRPHLQYHTCPCCRPYAPHSIRNPENIDLRGPPDTSLCLSAPRIVPLPGRLSLPSLNHFPFICIAKRIRSAPITLPCVANSHLRIKRLAIAQDIQVQHCSTGDLFTAREEIIAADLWISGQAVKCRERRTGMR